MPKKKPSYTVKSAGDVVARTPHHHLAVFIAGQYLHLHKSVTVTDNITRLVIHRFIYGHEQ